MKMIEIISEVTEKLRSNSEIWPKFLSKEINPDDT